VNVDTREFKFSAGCNFDVQKYPPCSRKKAASGFHNFVERASGNPDVGSAHAAAWTKLQRRRLAWRGAEDGSSQWEISRLAPALFAECLSAPSNHNSVIPTSSGDCPTSSPCARKDGSAWSTNRTSAPGIFYFNVRSRIDPRALRPLLERRAAAWTRHCHLHPAARA